MTTEKMAVPAEKLAVPAEKLALLDCSLHTPQLISFLTSPL